MKDEKAARLAAALRQNLRRRKGQARGDAPQPPTQSLPPPLPSPPKRGADDPVS